MLLDPFEEQFDLPAGLVVQVNTLGSSPWMTLSTLSNRVYFGDSLLGTTTGYANSDAAVIKDRLGSVQPSYAYGTDTGSGEQTSPGDDFATYWKHSSTGFEYAMNRYYSTGYGRFLTVDPFGGSGMAVSPLSWNRYAYSSGDPVNQMDPSGLDDIGDPDPDTPPFGCDLFGGCVPGCPVGMINAALGISTGFLPGLGDEDFCFVLPIVPVFLQGGGGAGPECFAQLKDRPVKDSIASKFDAVHTFWRVQGDIAGVIEQFILTAGPLIKPGSTIQYLDAWAIPGNSAGQDNSAQHLVWSSGLSGSLCASVDRMIIAAERFPQNQILYRPVSALGFGGPNSNSAAHYFAIAGGFDPTAPWNAYGWPAGLGFS